MLAWDLNALSSSGHSVSVGTNCIIQISHLQTGGADKLLWKKYEDLDEKKILANTILCKE